MTEEDADKMLRAACDFQGKSLQAREVCRDQYRRAETSEQNTLRILIDGQIALLAEKVVDRIECTSPAISYQIGVSASFIRSHFIVADSILQGDLLESLIIIRKQLESLARLHEIDSKPLEKLAKKVPNIQNVLKGEAGRLYGHLSEVAHYSTPRVGELLDVVERGELIGPSLLPTYQPERSGACFDMNCFIAVYFIGWMVEKLPTWYPGYDNAREMQRLGDTILLALRCGVINVPNSPA